MIEIKTGSFSLKGSKLNVPRFEYLSNNELVTEDDFENSSQIDRSEINPRIESQN